MSVDLSPSGFLSCEANFPEPGDVGPVQWERGERPAVYNRMVLIFLKFP